MAQFLSICEEIVADRTMGITLTNMDTYNILKAIFGYRWLYTVKNQRSEGQTTLTLSMSEQDKYDLKVYALKEHMSVSKLICKWLHEHKKEE